MPFSKIESRQSSICYIVSGMPREAQWTCMVGCQQLLEASDICKLHGERSNIRGSLGTPFPDTSSSRRWSGSRVLHPQPIVLNYIGSDEQGSVIMLVLVYLSGMQI